MIDEGIAMCQWAYYGITTAEDEEAAMITAETPGAYIMDRGGKHKGYPKITKEQVEELRAQGLPWAEIATILGIPKQALHHRWYRWKRQESKNTPNGAEVREG